MEIDFITALGRLLRDGKLRDDFGLHPQAAASEIKLRPEDWPDFLKLVPEDLEFQARILLRKRSELVRQLLPETVRRADENFWRLFHEYARTNWPAEPRTALEDARQFCQHLQEQHPEFFCKSEFNRLGFALSKKHLTIHCLFRETIRHRRRPMLQIFFRWRSARWWEFVFHFGL